MATRLRDYNVNSLGSALSILEETSPQDGIEKFSSLNENELMHQSSLVNTLRTEWKLDRPETDLYGFLADRGIDKPLEAVVLSFHRFLNGSYEENYQKLNDDTNKIFKK